LSNAKETDIWLEDFLTGLFGRMDIDVWVAQLDINEADRTYTAILDGRDKARIIGRDGQVLDAIQHLAIAAAANEGFVNDRIVVDVDDYRERRDARIHEDAKEAISEVLQKKVPVDLPPMNSRDRRMVHMIAAAVDGVTTESLGEGDERYVRLIPSV
jgi:spoIIIJ-associated protein